MINIEAIHMLENIASDVKLVESTMFFYLNYTLGLIVLLGCINVINKLTNNVLFVFGIIPRHLFGLLGIFCSPFLHGNFNHLFFIFIYFFFHTFLNDNQVMFVSIFFYL